MRPRRGEGGNKQSTRLQQESGWDHVEVRSSGKHEKRLRKTKRQMLLGPRDGCIARLKNAKRRPWTKVPVSRVRQGGEFETRLKETRGGKVH